MDEEIIEEFNERFATVEEALKYIADSQAKAEFIHKRDSKRFAEEQKQYEQRQKESEQRLDRIERLQEQTQRHLDHITKVLRFNIEEYEFQEDKLRKAGEILSRKREG